MTRGMGADSEGFRRVGRVLVAAMLAVVLSVSASALYARYRLSNAAEFFNISANAAPTISYMGNARTHLHRLDYEVDHAVAGPSGSVPAGRIDRELRQLHEAISLNESVPMFPGEPELHQRLRPALARLDRTVAAALAKKRAGDQSGATRAVFDEMDPAIQDVDDLLAQLLELNSNHLAADAATIQRTQRRNDLSVYALFGGSIVLAAIATLLVIRAIRRYFAVVDRRSKELEYFAIQIGHDILNPLTPIAAALRIAKQQSADGIGPALERGMRGVDRIQRNVSGLLAFARAGERSPPEASTPLRPCIEGVVADLAAGARVVVEALPGGAVRCGEGVLARIVRAMLADALGRSDGGEVRLRVVAQQRSARIEVAAGPPQWGEIDLFAPRIRSVASGYPGIELEMLAARHLAETHEGRVGTTSAGGRCVTFAELPMA
jgi:signal transduction histidine kinase